MQHRGCAARASGLYAGLGQYLIPDRNKAPFLLEKVFEVSELTKQALIAANLGFDPASAAGAILMTAQSHYSGLRTLVFV